MVFISYYPIRDYFPDKTLIDDICNNQCLNKLEVNIILLNMILITSFYY